MRQEQDVVVLIIVINHATVNIHHVVVNMDGVVVHKIIVTVVLVNLDLV